MSYYYVTLCHYYTDYFSYYDYVRGSHPNYQELADTNSRPMLRAMTDKCPGAPETLQNEHASSLYEARSTYSAE